MRGPVLAVHHGFRLAQSLSVRVTIIDPMSYMSVIRTALDPCTNPIVLLSCLAFF